MELTAAGATDPALADQWSATGSATIAGEATATDVRPPDVGGTVRPTISPTTLDAPALEPSLALPAPSVSAPAKGEAASLLDSTMGPEVHARVAQLLAPAASAGAAHEVGVTAVGTQVRTALDEDQQRTTAQQQAALDGAQNETAQLRAGWQSERSAAVAAHSGEIQAESGRVRAEASATIAAANQQAKVHADQGEQEARQSSTSEAGSSEGTSWWDRVKSTGRSVVSAVGSVASAVMSTVRGILDAARQRVLGALSALATTIRAKVAAAVAALRAGVRRAAAAVSETLRRTRELLTRLAAGLIARCTQLWRAAAQRLATLWRAVTAAAHAAFAAAQSVVRRIGSALKTVGEILRLLSSKILGTVFEAMKDPQGKVVTPITAMAAPMAAQVPEGMDARAQAHVDAGVPTSEAPVVQRQEAAPPAPVGEGFWSGVWRHVKTAGANFVAHWGEVLAKVVLAILLWFPMLVEEGPKLWEECKGVVNGGGGLDRLDHVLGVLRHLVNIVAGTLATVGVWGMLFAWAGTPIAEAATVAAYEALSLQVLAADVALAVLEMGKAWYSSTRPGVVPQVREQYLGMFTGSLIATVIAAVMFALGAIASRLGKAFKARRLATVAEAEGEGARPRTGGDEHGTPSTPRERTPLTPEEVAGGVRMAKDLPGGGRLRLLSDGRLVVCHSPCQSIASRFHTELNAGTQQSEGFRQRLESIAEKERTAVGANDIRGEEEAFNLADALNSELEGVRLRRISGTTGVSEAELTNLIRLAADDANLVERLLNRLSGDPRRVAKVTGLLNAARGDANAMARLARAVEDFPAAQRPSGGTVADSRLHPFAAESDMRHFLERHTVECFDFNQIKPDNTFFRPGTTSGQIEDAIVAAIEQMRKNGDPFQPRELRVITLNEGPMSRATFQIKRDVVGGTMQIVQFFPFAGGTMINFTREEMQAIGRFIGRIP